MITIILTFFLINLGGYVHNTESSLACPDWPLCYGQVFPKMEGGILIEHSHRLLASLVGFFTIILVFLHAKKRKVNNHAFKVSVGALFLVIFQGILGGLTVIFKLPTMVSTAHLGTSMLFFATLIYIYHLSAPKLFNNAVAKSEWNPNIKTFYLLSLGFIYAQMLLGALMRHLGLGSACGLGIENAFACFDTGTWGKTLFPASVQSQIHMGHRLFAMVVGAAVIWAVIKLLKLLSKSQNIHWINWIPVPLVIIQIILGVVSISTNIGQISTTLHLGGAALLFASMWKNYLEICDLEVFSVGEKKTSFLGDIISLTKPRLSALVIATSAMGLFLAPGKISFFRGLIAILATHGVVSGACIINCYMEKDIDKLMERTKLRPLPSGRINPDLALYLGVSLIFICILVLFWLINPLTAILAFVATVFYVFLYTPLKTKTTLALFAGAIPGAIPPLMGWTSVTAQIDPYALILFGILFLWQLPHFLAISIYHAEDYNNAGIKVLPKTLGIHGTILRIIFYTLLLAVISFLPYSLGINSLTYRNSVVVLGGAFFVYSLLGLFLEKNKIGLMLWSRRYFYASLIYLPCVFVMMIFFK
ncbi:MAG: heme o synthase [Bacteriovoracaceae bacterium]